MVFVFMVFVWQINNDVRNLKSVFEAVLRSQKLELLQKLFENTDAARKGWLSKSEPKLEVSRIICGRSCRMPPWTADGKIIRCINCLNEFVEMCSSK